MNLFAVQVKTRSEKLFIKRAVLIKMDREVSPWRLLFPQRSMNVRKDKSLKRKTCPCFPAMYFWRQANWRRSSTGIYGDRGLLSVSSQNASPKPLEGRDLALIKHFVSFGEVAGPSKVSFDENDRIVVKEGPLKGLEGRIIRVDKRKGRVKVQLDLYDECFPVDLSYELIQK
jgi:transcriptional antiterminator NusG